MTLLQEIEKLRTENKLLYATLKETKNPVTGIKTGNIDAIVITNEHATAIFTENAADKIYRILIEEMNEGAVTLAPDGIVLYCNSSFAAMVNQPLQTIVGQPFNSFVEETSRQRFDNLFLVINRHPLREQLYLHVKERDPLPILMSVNTIKPENAALISVILTDLSLQVKHQEALKSKTIQLEQNNAELESANKDLTTFSHVSSHDLQEPLRKIQNFISRLFLEEENKLSEAGKGYLQRMASTAKRMRLLIDDLLVYAQTKNSDRQFEKTDLKIIISEVKKDYADRLAEKQGTINVTNLGNAAVIPFQFHQLMQNLISNSVKFSKPGRKLRIKIRSKLITMDVPANAEKSSKADYCHISYSDNGIGFDAQYSLRIFEVFQRLHSQEEFPGTGIGLAICKRIIENHKGFITASGKPDKGAKFDMYIPEPGSSLIDEQKTKLFIEAAEKK